MDIRIEDIKAHAGQTIFLRGLDYYKKGLVTFDRIDADSFEATVRGTRLYKVVAKQKYQGITTSCTCPYWTFCKHMVAALLAARNYYKKHGSELVYKKTHPHWQNFLSRAVQANRETASAALVRPKWKLIYLIDIHDEFWSITPKKAYLKKNGEMGRLQPIRPTELTKRDLKTAPNDLMVISFLRQLGEHYSTFYSSGFGYFNDFDYNTIYFKYGVEIGIIFDYLMQSEIYMDYNDDSYEPIHYWDNPGRVEFKYIEDNKVLKLKPFLVLDDNAYEVNEKIKVLTQNPVWILHELSNLVRIENIKKPDLIIPFTQEKISVDIPKKEIAQFIETAFETLADSVPIPIPESIPVNTLNEITGKRLYLTEGFNQLELQLVFLYQDFEVDAINRQESLLRKSKEGQALYRIDRDFDGERRVWEQLMETGLRELPGKGFRIVDSRAMDWLFNNIPVLVEQGFEIFGQEKLKKYRVRTGSPNVRIGISSGIDWFDLNIEIDIEGMLISLKQLKKALTKQQRYIRLTDGSFARLPDDWVKKFQHLFNLGEPDGENVKVSRFHVTLIDALFEKAALQNADVDYKKSYEQLINFRGIKRRRLPKNLHGKLRPYQKAGYDWLLFLKDYSFGGCLADDMGLGKTIQALALLQKEKERGNRTPSLIVCPTSVVFNWLNEIDKFTPDLKVLVHVGLDRTREIKNFEGYDIILTSYGIMRNDMYMLKDFHFHYIILDESQKIKNPLSQTAKAAKILQSDYRLVLTGTPVENNTIELWSQFSFLNPGLLGSLNYFKRSFTSPIERHRDEETAKFLKKMIFPFVLRRTKEIVEKDLPAKVEQTVYCSMNREQQKLYEHWRDYYRAMILDRIDEMGLDKARMNVLEGLVRLRQIACHPQLVDKETREDSGKFETLKEFVEEILAEDHKILIFSQFVKMLRIVRQYFDEKDIPYEYLDGHTRNRKKCVDRFQNDENVRVFLISLRAGGTGLNLTAADYVIHYDPWWNPAVEMQATDRAHRIGQDKNVFVYRLITKDSVEEKMLQLQQQKKQLVSNLITTDSSFFKSLTRKDVEVLFS